MIDGAEVMRAFRNDKADVGPGVRRADPGAVEADVDLLCDPRKVGHGFNHIDQRLARGRLGRAGGAGAVLDGIVGVG